MASGIWPVVNVQADAAAKHRYFDNTFTDFDPNVHNEFIEMNNDTYRIQDTFIQRIRQKTEIMLQNIMVHENDVSSSGFSVYTGVAGVAMTFLFASRRFRGDFNKIARSFIRLACSNPHRSRVNFLNGNSGVLILNAMISDKPEAREHLCERLEDMFKLVKSPNSDMPNELLYGRVGFLYSLLFMMKNGLPVNFTDSDVKDVIRIIIDQGRSLASVHKSKAPLKFEWHDKNYFGAAHGTAGILYILLQSRQYLSDGDLTNIIRPTIDHLLEKCRFKSGNLLSSEGSTTDRLVQWCHGSPGAVQLFCLAYEVFENPHYLTAAMQCGEVVWRRGLLRKGCGLCHGTSGNAYTFLSLYQLCKKREEFSEVESAKHLYRACAFAEWSSDLDEHRERCPDSYFSLYEGVAGTAYFLTDLLEPLEAAFPGYTVKSI